MLKPNRYNHRSAVTVVRQTRHLMAIRQAPRPTVRRLRPCQNQPSFGQSDSHTAIRCQALDAAKTGRYHTALRLFNQLIASPLVQAADYNNRGLIYFQNGLKAKALRDYNTAIELNSRLDSAYNNRANCYASQGQLQAALADYAVAIDLNPYNVRAHINQGATFRDLGQYEEAIDGFDWALRFDQFQGNIYAERGRTYHLQGDWNCAVADYQRALDYIPTTSQPLKGNALLRHQVEGWLQTLTHPLSIS